MAQPKPDDELKGGEIIEISDDEDFKTKLKSANENKKCVIVDFGASWCG